MGFWKKVDKSTPTSKVVGFFPNGEPYTMDLFDKNINKGEPSMSVSNSCNMTTDAKERKELPVFSGFINYFPDAMVAVAELSRIGNDQHNPGKPLHWDRSKSGDELDALTRHLIQAGTIDTDGVRHSSKVAWRAMANLQKELEIENESDKGS